MSSTNDTNASPRIILHLGLGSFHRAHQAVYLNRLHALGDTRWQLAGGNLRPDMAETVAALSAQQGAYTLETVTPAGERAYERITAIKHIVPYEPSLAGLVELGAQERTGIISFTVTEAGYYLDSENRLDDSFAEMASDLDGTTQCATLYGALTLILRERVRRGGAPVTLLNCDNLRSNGDRLRAGLLDFLARRGELALRDWVLANTTCPNGMVDRITPRPSPEVAERVKAATGWDDRAALMGEHFIQWVLEDHFCNGRPDWERVGVQMVESVLPFEEAKIRILNASHSCIAWAGTLIGRKYIHESVAVPDIRRMAHEYVTQDVIPCLHTPERPSPLDLAAYRDVVLDRFSSPYLLDTNQRVVMDGYAKIAGFLWPTLRECIGRGASVLHTARLLALFYEFLGRWHRGELDFTYADQGMDPISAHALFQAKDPMAAFCADPLLWGPLAGNEQLGAAIRAAHREVQGFLHAHGVAV